MQKASLILKRLTVWSKLSFRRQTSETQQPAPVNLKTRGTLTDRLNFKNKQLQYVTCMSPLYNILTYIILIYFTLNCTWSKKTRSKCKLSHLNSTCNCNLIYSIILHQAVSCIPESSQQLQLPKGRNFATVILFSIYPASLKHRNLSLSLCNSTETEN